MDQDRLVEGLRAIADRVDDTAGAHRAVVGRARSRAIRHAAMSGLGVVLIVGSATLAMGRRAPDNPALPAPASKASAEGEIVFLSDRGEGYGQRIFTVEPDGADLREVSKGFGYSSVVDASPDGLEFVYDRALREGHGSLVLVDARSGEERVIYSDEESGAPPLVPQGPAFSPDGSKIAFYSGKGRIYVINKDGSGLRMVTEPDRSCGDFYPTWSPDGSQIAFAHDCPGGGIFVAPVSGGDARQVTQGAGHSEPDWSPDGTQIAFTRGGERGRGIYTVTIVDGSIDPIADQFSYSPSWSPDGSSIAFISEQVGHRDVWVMAADGSGRVAVTQDRHDDLSPVWIRIP